MKDDEDDEDVKEDEEEDWVRVTSGEMAWLSMMEERTSMAEGRR